MIESITLPNGDIHTFTSAFDRSAKDNFQVPSELPAEDWSFNRKALRKALNVYKGPRLRGFKLETHGSKAKFFANHSRLVQWLSNASLKDCQRAKWSRVYKSL